MAVRWITEADVENPTDPATAYSVEAASWILYKLTGEKYPGVAQRTEWYGRENTTCSTCLPGFGDASLGVEHRHVFYTSTQQKRIRLRGTPVVSIDSVTYQGSVLPPSDYWVENSQNLILRNGACWDLNSGVQVVYNSGIRPPEAGRMAAVRLANEFILAVSDPGECRLPDRVTSISRQGVSYDLLDPQDFLTEGRTGIYEIDLFIKAANPVNAKKKPRVFIPGGLNGATRR